ncbi:MAG: SDR family NAD(P)-dependent oxidoreductase [Bacteroidales bacterium]|nr:SDR family NAD(P)-dependent oxidoreductase [Bacteroidales bacterium]MCM1147203.1 SDR family NAD(P)-dependent oxidoreductase [Bacteroidales bacterium]MCM1205429.1 SDR family NAD(P)-dependent oxidoreductase [Bacillota bacterium]MCM1509766.1 SDR family NAD(P)-dependent oxidoreductase [Clostridium sp.]
MSINRSNTPRKAVITGATSGIGREVAKVLASQGWEIAVAGRREERLVELQKELPHVVAIKRIDVTDKDAPQKLEELILELGGMDLYFHSSGIGYQNVDLDVEKEMATVATNGMGFTRMVTAAFHYFSAHPGQKGHIAVISSIAGTKGLGASPAYSSTKRFQSHYMECLAQLAHIRGLDIAFTDIRPGFVTTELIQDCNYPMNMDAAYVARKIVSGINRKKYVLTIDWRYRIIVAFWRLVPGWLWRRMKIKS